MAQVWSAASGGLFPSGDVPSNYCGAVVKGEITFFYGLPVKNWKGFF